MGPVSIETETCCKYHISNGVLPKTIIFPIYNSWYVVVARFSIKCMCFMGFENDINILQSLNF